MIPLEVQRHELADLCRRRHIRELSVFGSVARGESRPNSDVDILIEFEPTARTGFIGLSELSRELEALFGCPVDVVTKRGLHPLIRDRVLAEAEVLFAA